MVPRTFAAGGMAPWGAMIERLCGVVVEDVEPSSLAKVRVIGARLEVLRN
jgi:hypothetical protein